MYERIRKMNDLYVTRRRQYSDVEDFDFFTRGGLCFDDVSYTIRAASLYKNINDLFYGRLTNKELVGQFIDDFDLYHIYDDDAVLELMYDEYDYYNFVESVLDGFPALIEDIEEHIKCLVSEFLED